MRLRNAGGIDDAERTLTSLKYACETVRNGKAVASLRDDYLNWVDTADRHFRNLFDDQGMVDALYSTAYWEIRRITQATPQPYRLVHAEIDNQLRRIEDALAQLARFRTFASHPGTIVVPDTSAFIQGEIFTQLLWPKKMGIKGVVRLVVPIIVIEQLDKLKDTGNSRAGDRARKVLKLLREQRRTVTPGVPAPVRAGVTVEIFLDDGWQHRHPIDDDEIIEQARVIQQMVPGEVTLACVDASMEFRALERGFKVFEVPPPAAASAPTV
ncbi:PIN domain-containing protein [Streptomyces sp. NPDC050508]|uniref:PIN domain-containing protein n=1 Tax=Streptomyces sp. NPDC050508 TaxID=3155405 RepID=UPI003424C6C1